MDRPRSHASKAPYARNEGRKSLFSKVKDSMRDMLSPSWLTDMVSSSNKESPPVTTQSTSASPSVPMSSQSAMQRQSVATPMFQPYQGGVLGNGQPRTLDFSRATSVAGSPGMLSARGLPTAQQQHTPGVTRIPVPAPCEAGMPTYPPATFPPPVAQFTSAQLPLNRLITEKSDSVLAHVDSVETMSQRSDSSKSTSGCSSMNPQHESNPLQTRDAQKRKTDNVTADLSPVSEQAPKRQKLEVSINGGALFTRRLSDSFTQARPAASSDRPAFNASLFASPIGNDASVLGNSFHESSFYPSKTRFGGRSAITSRAQKRKTDLNQSLPSRLSIPVKVFMKAKPRVQLNQEAVTSSTAKRILEALDKMPTPVNDAKKIPLLMPNWSQNPKFFARNETALKNAGPPTRSININRQASISSNRQVSLVSPQQPPSSKALEKQPDVMATRTTRPVPARSADGSALGVGVSQPAPVPSAGASGKMKRDKSYHRGSASAKPVGLENEDTVIIPSLQTDFTLSVAAMPQFSFQTPSSQPPSNPRSGFGGFTSPADKVVKPGVKGVDGSPAEKPKMNFTFSSPIAEIVPSDKPASPQKPSGFQFSSPISLDGDRGTGGSAGSAARKLSASPAQGNLPTLATNKTSANMEYTFSTAPKPKPGFGSDSSIGSFKPATELKQGSVMDILGGGGGKFSFSTPVSLASSGSKANTGNGPVSGSADQPSSSSVNSSLGQQNALASKAEPPLSSLFKKSGWTCDVCLVNNTDVTDKCVACMSAKPAPKQDTAKKQPDLGSLFKKSGWTCDVCLINNKDELQKCAACQSAKPQSKQTAVSSSSSSSLTGLGGVLPGNWICSTCLIQNKKDATVCAACGVKPSASTSTTKASPLAKSDSVMEKFKPSSGGQWECEVCLVQNKPDANSCAACTALKPLKAFKPPAGDWTCDTCLVSNKSGAVNCIACNYARPGPPRTQAVPSCVKSFSLCQAGSTGSSTTATESSGIKVNSTGGFTFTATTNNTSNKSGFSFDTSVKTSTSSSMGGGFKFNASNSSSKSSDSTNSTGGFTFGGSSSKAETNSGSAGGFKIDSSSNGPSSGFSFSGSASAKTNGSSDSKVEINKSTSSIGGFKFGADATDLTGEKTPSVNSASEPPCSIAANEPKSASGFTFGAAGKLPSETSSNAGFGSGFSFKPSDSVTCASKTSIDGSASTVTTTSQSIPGLGFSQAAVTMTSESLTLPKVTSSNATVGFSITAAVTEKSTPSQGLQSKASFGGFTFGAGSANSTKTGDSSSTSSGTDGGLSFGVKSSTASTTVTPVGGGQASAAPVTGLFMFGAGQNTTSASCTSTAGQASTVTPVFGMATSVSTTTSTAASTATSLSSGFAFGQSSSSVAPAQSGSTPSLFQFGQTSVPATFNFGTNANKPSAFGGTAPAFGQKTETPSTGSSSLFKFGQSASQAPTPGLTSSFSVPAFGTQTSSSASVFGSSSGAAFGSNSGSSGPLFGGAGFGSTTASATPVFGSAASGQGSSDGSLVQANPPAAQTFGGGFGSATNSTPASGGLFQFGAKPPESGPAPAASGFNFTANTGTPSINFSAQAQAPAVNAFSATPATEGRKIKKAVRKIRR